MIVIDHLFSNSHLASVEAKELKLQWENLDVNHPWLKVLKRENHITIEKLLRLTIAVYNYSKLLTPSAWSWPSQSLASLLTEKQI